MLHKILDEDVMSKMTSVAGETGAGGRQASSSLPGSGRVQGRPSSVSRQLSYNRLLQLLVVKTCFLF